MVRKMMAMLVVVAMLGILPMLGGCNKNEVKTHSETTTNSPGETHTVVE